jgi:hypothetical protein
VSQYASVIAADTGIPDFRDPPASATEAQKIAATTAAQRQMNVDALASDFGINVVTSTSDAEYPAVGADCNDTTGIPPATCTEKAANDRRLAMCQDFWQHNKTFFEGTDRILTSPLSGTTRGMVDGMNPINSAPVGGAQFFVDEGLDGIDGYAIYYQTDGAAAGDPGTLLLYGTATMPTRGVLHVHMTSPGSINPTAELAIFPDLDQDDVQF